MTHNARGNVKLSESQSASSVHGGCEMEMVSVIIPTYNRADMLVDTIEAVFAQTYRPIEVVVVDDGSTDDTREVISRRWPEINYVWQEHHGRPSVGRNAGIRHSRGEFIALLDSDDLMLPQQLETLVRFLRDHPHIQFAFSDFFVMEHDGIQDKTFLTNHARFATTPKVTSGPGRCVLRRDEAYEALMFGNFIGTSSVMARRQIFDRVGLFDESLHNGDDLDMWFRIAREYDIGFIVEPLTACRRTPDSISSKIYIHEAKLVVAERQARYQMSPEARGALLRYIADIHFDIGCRESQHGCYWRATASFLRAIARRPRWPLPYWALTKVVVRAALGAKRVEILRSAMQTIRYRRGRCVS